MGVNRTLLYAGVFLVAIGGVVVATDLGVVDEAVLADILSLWPLGVIALGLGLVLRRTRISLSGGMLAAAVPGLLVGSAFAAAPRFTDFCGMGGELVPVTTQQGTLGEATSVRVTLECGSLDVGTAEGDDWQLVARATEGGRAPSILPQPGRLAIASTNNEGWLTGGRDDWALTLPTAALVEVFLDINAGRGDIDLAGATIDRLHVGANAADVHVDLSTATIAELTGEVDFGSLSVRLPDGDLVGAFTVNAGRIQICTPPDLGLRVVADESMGDVSIDGRHLGRTNYVSANYDTAEHRADLEIHADFGAVEINPIGGCR
jgi:hypothetical protein